MAVGSLAKIGQNLVVRVQEKGDHYCYESAELGSSHTLSDKSVVDKGEQLGHEQAGVQKKEEYPALALGDEEQQR
ncbi:hypothetical protein BGZ97_009732 [Linnemannia gamsii]|jgi:hypothetical protein|uniref:Uncharacterized protein n=1 Tax=Linnemannia gamsii TaxID=64522 RepID=A0A9P6R9N4_9FUNG|nr:hypothetical protein BGZ97_009732 [Linnemannia gamsii]